ncbi:MAG: roadblock/LC7 domain-containing protein [Actinobacteria bacterium]|nr:roadblock/LC7 domain-containing protein [Actinomycetota bacterium]
MRPTVTTDPIYELMRSYLEIDGVLAAILVSDQGLVVNGAQSGQIDIDTISALVVDTLTSAQRFGVEAGVGRVDTLTVEFEELSVLLAPFDHDLMLALVGTPGAFLRNGGLPLM